VARTWRGVIEEYGDRLPVGPATPVVTLGEGGTPLVVAEHRDGESARVLGVIYLKDVVKEGISERFAELRPRIVWDRTAGTVRGRKGARQLAVTNAGTIPDRGLYGVHLPDGRRVGELDEEMVYESRRGEVFMLGASSWRIEDITLDRVVVSPAPGEPGKMPFWHGDGPGRPLELGRAVGQFVREVRHAPASTAFDRLRDRHGLDELAAHERFAGRGW